MTALPRLAVLLAALLVAVTTLAPSPPAAQPWKPFSAEVTSEPPDYAAWEDQLARAEDMLAPPVASSGELEALRAELLDWRGRFLAAQDINDSRIATLRQQLDALGAPPAEGETEAAPVAEQREQLNSRLRELRAPVMRAELAYRRADGLIAEIDDTFRARQADKVMRRGPVPVNPANWRAGFEALRSGLVSLRDGFLAAWDSPARREAVQSNSIRIAALVALGGVLMLRGRQWFEWLASKALTIRSRRGQGGLEFATSLGQIVAPFLGLLALVAALDLASLLYVESAQMATIVPLAALAILVARWLGTRVFPKEDDRIGSLTLPAERHAEGRLYTLALGVIFALHLLLRALDDIDRLEPAARAVLNFPLLVVAGLVLLRMGQLLRAHVRAEREAHDDPSRKLWLMGLFGRALLLVGVAGPVLAAIGYQTAAISVIYPSMLTLALLALLNILQKLVADLYTLFAGQDASAADSLVPLLLGFVLTLLSLPIFALVWGARAADLFELWVRFREGISIGDTRVAPGDFVTFALVFLVGYILTRVVQGTLRSSVLPKTGLDLGGRNAIVAGLGYVGIILAAVIAITTAGIDLSSLALVAGALSVGIGFGLQNVVSNFVSGIILLIERPISEGDWIEVGDNMGYVRDISVRSTRMETFDRTDVIIPNADLVSGTVTNYTHGKLVGRLIVPVGVAHGSDTRQVERILHEIAEAHPQVVLNPPPQVLFQGFGDSALNFEIRAVLRDVNWILDVKSAMNFEISRRFAEEEIVLPFPQRAVWLRTPDALRALHNPSSPSESAEQTGTAAPHLAESDMGEGDGQADAS